MTALRTLFTVREIAGLVDGELFFPSTGLAEGSDRDAPVTHVSIDSRNCHEGSMFVPLPGRFTDGHAFITDAVSKGGATLVLVAQQYEREHRGELTALRERSAFAYLVVPEVLRCLQDLARYYLGKFPELTKIGITGSNGKTTTKEMVASVLRRHAETYASQGNFNSEIGLPLSVFELDRDQRYGVFEMAMNRRGEMELLADILRPDMALITNIGRAHIGLLGSVSKIAEEKKRIFSRFSGQQQAFLPEHDPYLEFLSRGINGRVHLFGRFSTPDVTGVTDRGIEGSLIHWHGYDMRLSLPGDHNVLNALGAISIGLELGVPPADIRDGIEAVHAQFGRSEIIRGRITVIQDCYNANPDSVRQSILLLDRTAWSGRKVLVLGSMKELGDETAALHEEIARLAATTHAELLYFVGAENERSPNAASDAGFRGEILWAEDADSAAAELPGKIKEGDLVLLKGSRSMGLERLTPILLAEQR